jgi:YHS domain-containing protein
MRVDETGARGAKLTSDFQGKTYSFCGQACKKRFDAGPEKFLVAAGSN